MHIHTQLRKLAFAQVFPAPKIVSRGSRIFIGLQQLIRSLANYDQLYHHVYFDFGGNMYPLAGSWPHLPNDTFEAAFITGDNKLYNPNKKYLIYLGGNTTCYQVLVAEMLDIYKAYNNQLILIGFNPPGVGLSPGYTEDLDHYASALHSVIDNLHNNGIAYDHIMVVGHSLGGGVAAKVVAKLQHNNKNVSLFVDRTMHSIGEAVGATFKNIFPLALLRKTLGYLLYLFAKLLVRILKLELNVAEHFKNINAISPGAAKGIMVHDDEILQDCCLSQGVSLTPHFQEFKLREDDAHRRPHSKPRTELIAVDGRQTADQFFHSVLRSFVNSLT